MRLPSTHHRTRETPREPQQQCQSAEPFADPSSASRRAVCRRHLPRRDEGRRPDPAPARRPADRGARRGSQSNGARRAHRHRSVHPGRHRAAPANQGPVEAPAHQGRRSRLRGEADGRGPSRAAHRRAARRSGSTSASSMQCRRGSATSSSRRCSRWWRRWSAPGTFSPRCVFLEQTTGCIAAVRRIEGLRSFIVPASRGEVTSAGAAALPPQRRPRWSSSPRRCMTA